MLLMTGTAIGLGALGTALLFAPEELGRALGAPVGAGPWLQLLGGACLGLGALDWLTRRSLIGGIYGRPVAVANQLHFTVGALALVRHGGGPDPTPAFIVLGAAYVVGALVFNALAFGPAPKTGPAQT